MDKHGQAVHPLMVPKSQNWLAEIAVNETGLKVPCCWLLVGPVVVEDVGPSPETPGTSGLTLTLPQACSAELGKAAIEPPPGGTVATRLFVPLELSGSVTATE